MPKESRVSPFVKQCFVTCTVGLNIVGTGCVLGYPAILLPQLQSPESTITISSQAASWIASITAVMMLIGSLVVAPIMDRFGRKIAHYAVTLPAIVGWGIIIVANNFPTIFIGRILGGLSFGMLFSLRSVLIGEYTSPKNRGAFLTTVSLTQAFGIFFVHLIGSLMTWTMTAVVCVLFSIASLIMIFFCPESPSWLASRGKYDESRKVFRWLRGNEEEDELEEMIQARILIRKAKTPENKKINRFRRMLITIRKKEFYKPITLMVHANIMVNFAGGTIMAAYSTVILGLMLGPEANVHFWMIVLDTQRIIFNAGAIYVINKTKRRTMMFLTGGLCVLSSLAIALYAYMKDQGLMTYNSLWIPVILINVNYFTVATGMVPLPNVIAGEVFPLEYKSIAGMISIWAAAAFMFTALKTFPGLIEGVGLHGTYVVYSAILFYNLVVIWFLLPETKGRTLQEIEDEFRGRPLAREEREARMSLEMDPIVAFKRKESERRCSVPLLS
ncbi:unnamed protein product [Diatraea saccharalis]|uniref:Major facilitator superfamily (MFS) profile domain-containing protein n=1 Tax=Diatraea saccharalis TaxID=40085 RepID=A0A9N9RGR9_9NEOP|nr:unnamed protein product [Diatraea saccharalis]